MNHAEELIAQLRIIGRLQDFGSGARFARRFQGIGAEERIHWHLRRSCFVRRAKADVLPQLPAKRQVAVPVALDNERDYRLAEEDVIAWLREQPLDLRELESRVAAALRAERLAQLNALRRLASRGKGGRRDGMDRGLPRVRRAARRVRRPSRDAGPAGRALPGRAAPARPRLDRRARGGRPALPGGRLAAARVRHARRRPGHHAHARVQRRLPRPGVDPGDARPGRGPLPPHRPARRGDRLVPARRARRSTRRCSS